MGPTNYHVDNTDDHTCLSIDSFVGPKIDGMTHLCSARQWHNIERSPVHTPRSTFASPMISLEMTVAYSYYPSLVFARILTFPTQPLALDIA